MSKVDICDLHADLLAYLGKEESHSDLDPQSRASYTQLKAGGVKFQALPIFSETKKGSVAVAKREVEIYRKLASSRWEKARGPLKLKGKRKIQTLLAIENCSGFIEEDEPLDLLFSRLDELQKEFSPLLYITTTWHHENRLGGGNRTHIGLKDDGKAFLDYLDKKKIAVDLSHSSDELARDIIETIDKRGFVIPVIASHSNFRAVEKDEPRNLPDDVAKEIIRRGGLIGINVIADFVGSPFEEKWIGHIAHGLELGGKMNLALGADFFDDKDLMEKYKDHPPCFVPGYEDASCYPKLLAHIRKNFQDEFVGQIAHQNVMDYLTRWQLF